MVDTTGKTPLEIVREALRAYREDYSAYQETAYLLKSPANAQDLLEAVEDLRAGRYQRRELLDDAD